MSSPCSNRCERLVPAFFIPRLSIAGLQNVAHVPMDISVNSTISTVLTTAVPLENLPVAVRASSKVESRWRLWSKPGVLALQSV